MISYRIGSCRNHGNVGVVGFDAETLYGFDRLRMMFFDYDGDRDHDLPHAAFDWLDQYAPYYHLEAIMVVVKGQDRLFYEDFMGVLHVYEPNTAFMLRMKFDAKPMDEGWREAFETRGFNAIYPGHTGLVAPEYAKTLRWQHRQKR
ncbi:MAG: hypothetical protein EOP84_02690 [Verrucomicrobiaceae bacterium]|nr:MAG: hypothetical protein EOP84_02690 [Verrucomicrobiaceae bacterium]